MLRINEYTYIDNSLITCAEYQLFLDEMQDYSQTYIPELWRSSQFPSGQALAPVLGVRPYAAQAFCEWLTNRETGEWVYRVPTVAESTSFPVTFYGKQQIGYSEESYWAMDNNKSQIVLVEVNSSKVHLIGSNLEIIRNNPSAGGIRIVKERQILL